jgi:serine O-acetyltransferase
MNLPSFLHKWMAFYFSSFSRDWIDSAVEGWDEGRKLFLSDLTLKYASLTSVDDLGADVCDVVETDSTIEACLYYRLARSIFLCDPQHPSLRYFAQLMKFKTGSEIYYSTEIGPRLRIEHGVGIVIGPRNRIGSDFIVHQGVTLGQRRTFSPHEKMTIGDHCVIFAGAKVLGTVTIGDHVKIGANAVLLTDAESHCTYGGIPAVKIVKTSAR